MKGHLPEVDSGGGEGRLEGGAHHPGQAGEQPTATDPRLEPSAERSPRLRPHQGKPCPAAPAGNPPRLQLGPGGACSPCSPAFLLRTSLQNHAPNFLFSAKQRSSPCAPRSAAVLPQLAGPGWQFSATPEETHFGWWQACCPRTGHWGQKGRKTHGGGELLCAPGRGGTAPVSTSVLPGAICSSGVSHRSPHGAVADSGGTPRPARRPKGPARPERRECELRQGSPLLDREPHEAAAGTEWARSRNTAARPRRPAPVRSARRNSSASNCDYRHVPLSLAATSPPDCCSQYTRFPVTSSCSEDSFPEGQDVSDPKLFAVEAKPQQVPLRCATHSLLAAPLPGRKLCPGHSPLGMLGT
ncbi:uncharacterized protein LOC122222690 [Panthera leo]|uniref:uncharacterized protein LOC122222690 n=1 Tax=Panthera leo TaxID=9689 RepID=UPI001C6A16BC|nr:uncharacterized protein LOC122222690 [Panthera leo]